MMALMTGLVSAEANSAAQVVPKGILPITLRYNVNSLLLWKEFVILACCDGTELIKQKKRSKGGPWRVCLLWWVGQPQRSKHGTGTQHSYPQRILRINTITKCLTRGYFDCFDKDSFELPELFSVIYY